MLAFSFGPDEIAAKRFEFLYRGLIIMGNQNTQKGLSVLTRELALLDKLEAISHPCDCGRLVPGTKEPDREIAAAEDGAHTLTLDEAEFDLLYQYVSTVPWAIGTSSRGAIEALAWLKGRH